MFPRANFTMCMRSICSFQRPVLSMSWIAGMSTRPTPYVAFGRRFLCYSRQVEHGCPSCLFGADGSKHRCDLRSDNCLGRLLLSAGLSRSSAPHLLQRSGIGQSAGISDQSVRFARIDYLRALQKPLASGTLFQMDQAASSNQTFLRYVRECGEDTDMDRCFGLCPRRHRQEASQPRRFALHFAIDFVGHPFREDAHPASLSGQRLHFGEQHAL